ncbi:hypothetical protein N5I84_22185 [Ralstonia sp. CHL-2022]|nr:hypothetical protein [Ralstonia mojiangensis]MCT7298900.1 hypothetical protein [Ralstonia mojiangensis]
MKLDVEGKAGVVGNLAVGALLLLAGLRCNLGGILLPELRNSGTKA